MDTNTQNTVHPIQLFTLKKIMSDEFEDTQWLVDRLIPVGGITCISGKPGVGKSFITLYLAKSIAEGIPFAGNFETRQSSVCVLSKEDPRRLIQSRLRDLGFTDSLPITFSDDMSVFCNTKNQFDRMYDLLEKTKSEVLIIDSFIRIVGGDENLSKDVAKVHEFFKALTQHGITIIFTHHQGKEDRGSSGIDKPRGSSDISAMVDSLLNVSKVDDFISIEQAKSRWDRPFNPFTVRFPSFTDSDRSFALTGVQTAEKENSPSQVESAVKDILGLFQKENKERYQSQIVRELLQTGGLYSEGTIKNALPILVRREQLIPRSEGNRIFYSLSPREVQTVGQEAIASVGLSNEKALPIAQEATCN